MPARTGKDFDGRWKFKILRLSGGMCTFARIGDLKIRDGVIEFTGHGLYLGRIVASGEVDGKGAASIDGYLGAHYLIEISGDFNETEARGSIDFLGRESCFGIWEATRASVD